MSLIQMLVNFEKVVLIVDMCGEGLMQRWQPVTCDDNDRPMNTYGIANIPVLITRLHRFINH